MTTATDDRRPAPMPLVELVNGTAGALEVDPGGERHRVILDRFSAVEAALALGRSSDAVLLAGKGHEEWQIVDGRRVPYSDRRAVEEVLRRGGGR